MTESTRDDLREQLAALAHQQWSGWMHYLFSRCLTPRTISEADFERWQGQMRTPYFALSEGEKDSDRKEADRVLALLAVHEPDKELQAKLVAAEARLAQLEQEKAKARRDARLFPIAGGPAIPWRTIAPHEPQALNNHNQTLERLAQRGGLSPCEAVAVLEDRACERMDDAVALKCLNELAGPAFEIQRLEAENARLLNEWREQDQALQDIFGACGVDDQPSCPDDVAKIAIELLADPHARRQE